MILQQPIQHVFKQLTDAIEEITDEAYTCKSDVLLNASIGQHVRHIIELFICLDQGYESGIVNYEKRKRDDRIETDRAFACGLIKKIYSRLSRPDKKMWLEADDYNDGSETLAIKTNYVRELAYNLEHTIHHMALIRIGIHDVSNIQLPASFGVAYSTIKFRKQTT